MRANQVPSYIIHRRPFRETSLIIDAIAQGYATHRPSGWHWY